MKVLFVKTTVGVPFPSFFDLGIGLMSAILKKEGHEVSYFSVQSLENLDRFKDRLKAFNPDIVGFSTTATVFKICDKLAGEVKKFNKKIICVVGGVHPTLVPNDLFSSKNYDGLAIGEGEYTLLDLVNRIKEKKEYWKTKGWWFRYKNKKYKNADVGFVRDLDVFPDPDREIFAREGLLYQEVLRDDIYRRKMEFMFERGCNFNCTYCSNYALKKRFGYGYVRYKSPKLAIQEIKNVMATYGFDYIVFQDDLFNANREWFLEFLDLYTKEIRLPYDCNFRVGVNIDREILKRMKKSGCNHIRLGVESGSEAMRKQLNRYMTDKQIIDTFDLIHSFKIVTYAFLIVGFPNENMAEMIKTVKLTARLKNPDLPIYSSYALFMFYPYPGTALYEYCLKHKILNTHNVSLQSREPFILTPSKRDTIFIYNNFEMLVEFCSYSNNFFQRIYRFLLISLYGISTNSRLFLWSRLAIFFIRFPVVTVKLFRKTWAV